MTSLSIFAMQPCHAASACFRYAHISYMATVSRLAALALHNLASWLNHRFGTSPAIDMTNTTTRGWEMYDVIYLQLVKQIEATTGIRVEQDLSWVEITDLHTRTCWA